MEPSLSDFASKSLHEQRLLYYNSRKNNIFRPRGSTLPNPTTSVADTIRQKEETIVEHVKVYENESNEQIRTLREQLKAVNASLMKERERSALAGRHKRVMKEAILRLKAEVRHLSAVIKSGAVIEPSKKEAEEDRISVSDLNESVVSAGGSSSHSVARAEFRKTIRSESISSVDSVETRETWITLADALVAADKVELTAVSCDCGRVHYVTQDGIVIEEPKNPDRVSGTDDASNSEMKQIPKSPDGITSPTTYRYQSSPVLNLPTVPREIYEMDLERLKNRSDVVLLQLGTVTARNRDLNDQLTANRIEIAQAKARISELESLLKIEADVANSELHARARLASMERDRDIARADAVLLASELSNVTGTPFVLKYLDGSVHSHDKVKFYSNNSAATSISSLNYIMSLQSKRIADLEAELSLLCVAFGAEKFRNRSTANKLENLPSSFSKSLSSGDSISNPPTSEAAAPAVLSAIEHTLEETSKTSENAESLLLSTKLYALDATSVASEHVVYAGKAPLAPSESSISSTASVMEATSLPIELAVYSATRLPSFPQVLAAVQALFAQRSRASFVRGSDKPQLPLQIYKLRPKLREVLDRYLHLGNQVRSSGNDNTTVPNGSDQADLRGGNLGLMSPGAKIRGILASPSLGLNSADPLSPMASSSDDIEANMSSPVLHSANIAIGFVREMLAAAREHVDHLPRYHSLWQSEDYERDPKGYASRTFNGSNVAKKVSRELQKTQLSLSSHSDNNRDRNPDDSTTVESPIPSPEPSSNSSSHGVSGLLSPEFVGKRHAHVSLSQQVDMLLKDLNSQYDTLFSLLSVSREVQSELAVSLGIVLPKVEAVHNLSDGGVESSVSSSSNDSGSHVLDDSIEAVRIAGRALAARSALELLSQVAKRSLKDISETEDKSDQNEVVAVLAFVQKCIDHYLSSKVADPVASQKGTSSETVVPHRRLLTRLLEHEPARALALEQENSQLKGENERLHALLVQADIAVHKGVSAAAALRARVQLLEGAAQALRDHFVVLAERSAADKQRMKIALEDWSDYAEFCKVRTEYLFGELQLLASHEIARVPFARAAQHVWNDFQSSKLTASSSNMLTGDKIDGISSTSTVGNSSNWGVSLRHGLSSPAARMEEVLIAASNLGSSSSSSSHGANSLISTLYSPERSIYNEQNNNVVLNPPRSPVITNEAVSHRTPLGSSNLNASLEDESLLNDPLNEPISTQLVNNFIPFGSPSDSNDDKCRKMSRGGRTESVRDSEKIRSISKGSQVTVADGYLESIRIRNRSQSQRQKRATEMEHMHSLERIADAEREERRDIRLRRASISAGLVESTNGSAAAETVRAIGTTNVSPSTERALESSLSLTRSLRKGNKQITSSVVETADGIVRRLDIDHSNAVMSSVVSNPRAGTVEVRARSLSPTKRMMTNSQFGDSQLKPISPSLFSTKEAIRFTENVKNIKNIPGVSFQSPNKAHSTDYSVSQGGKFRSHFRDTFTLPSPPPKFNFTHIKTPPMPQMGPLKALNSPEFNAAYDNLTAGISSRKPADELLRLAADLEASLTEVQSNSYVFSK